MMRWLISNALRLRVAVVILTVLLLITGTRIIRRYAF